ncbi:thioredoxin family protein [Botrimarina hoheduenensis]|uniref:Thiol:disulfide interchange protein n=1 Tax=Botrimarina hoheduenensis TaxID=2528000 RepID=A0A5C5VYC6_9BACT|nr:thioredoxin family protein [Botrimarina hoheduenensis]TWT43157.1 thiol:disulfide interchange protein precursor [Botrimarina hoheduenensis]
MSRPTEQTVPSWRLMLWRWFWRLTLVVSLAYAWYCFYVPPNDIAWANDIPAAQRQAAQTDRPLLMFFTGEWCVPCRIMKRTVFADEQVAARVNSKFIPVMIHVERPAAATALRHYQVAAWPTTIITDPQGSVLHRVQGGMSKTDFLALLSEPLPTE